jgi:hypothetical protein
VICGRNFFEMEDNRLPGHLYEAETLRNTEVEGSPPRSLHLQCDHLPPSLDGEYTLEQIARGTGWPPIVDRILLWSGSLAGRNRAPRVVSVRIQSKLPFSVDRFDGILVPTDFR